MLLKKLVRTLRSVALEDKQVLQMAMRNGLQSIDYEKIIKMKSLRQVLPKPTSGVLIFFTDHAKPNKPIGHFCLLFRTPRTGVVFFDPLGHSLHGILNITHNRNKLLTMLNSLSSGFHENRIPYQRQSKEVQTCGRHCITRWNAATLKPKEYSSLMHLPGMSADDVVTLLTLESDLPKLLKNYTV